MNGYVRNKTPYWRHAMKRSVGPGHKIPLDELYEQYGLKHDLEEGQPFVNWLKTVKLKDSDVWEVVYKKNKKVEEESPEQPIEVPKDNPLRSKFTGSNVDPVELVNMTVREARDNLPKVTDLKTLKYAHQEARQLANKDTLARLMKKRIEELEIARR